jgi:hypothetical protein
MWIFVMDIVFGNPISVLEPRFGGIDRERVSENFGWDYDRIAGALAKSWLHRLRSDHWKRFEAVRHRAGAETQPKRHMEEVHSVAFGRSCPGSTSSRLRSSLSGGLVVRLDRFLILSL